MSLANVVFMAGGETSDLSEWDTTSGTVTMESSVVYSGNYSYRLNSGAGNAIRTGTIFTATEARWRFRFRLSSLASGVICYCNASGPNGGLSYSAVEPGLIIQATGGSAQVVTSSILADTWYLVELRYKQGSGSDAEFGCKLEGASEVKSNDGTDTDAPLDIELLGGAADTGGFTYIDDCLAIDAATWPGDGKQIPLTLNGDSAFSDDYIPATNNYSYVDEIPFSDADEITNNKGADDDQYWTTDTQTVGSVNGVKIAQRLHDIGGFSGPAYIEAYNGSTSESSADITADLATGYGWHFWMPGSTLFTTQAHVDAAEPGAGCGHTSKFYYCSAAMFILDYTPPDAGAAVKDVIGGGIIPFAR